MTVLLSVVQKVVRCCLVASDYPLVTSRAPYSMVSIFLISRCPTMQSASKCFRKFCFSVGMASGNIGNLSRRGAAEGNITVERAVALPEGEGE